MTFESLAYFDAILTQVFSIVAKVGSLALLSSTLIGLIVLGFWSIVNELKGR